MCFEHFFGLLLDLWIFLCMQVNVDMMLKRYIEVWNCTSHESFLDVRILFSILNIALLIFNQSGIFVDTIETKNKKLKKWKHRCSTFVFLSYLPVFCVCMTLLIWYFVFPYIGNYLWSFKLYLLLISRIDFYAIR